MLRGKKRKRRSPLEKIVDSVIGTHRGRELKPVSRKVKIHVPGTQLGLFGEAIPTGSEKAVAMGKYFEYVTAAFYGGELEEITLVEPNGGSDDESAFDDDDSTPTATLMKPDVVHDRHVLESKACRSGQTLNLGDNQIDLYKRLQRDNPNKRFYFIAYRHRLRGIKSTWEGTKEELFSQLAQMTAYSLVIPLSLILELHYQAVKRRNTPIMYRHEPDEELQRVNPNIFDPCSCVKASAVTRLLTEPERVIDEIAPTDEDSYIGHAIDSSKYRVQRFMSPSRMGLYVRIIGGRESHRYRIGQYPIVKISDRNHRNWIRKFKPRYEKETSERLGVSEEPPF